METKQVAAAVEIIRIAYSLVAARGAAGKPAGHLYAEMMGAFSSLDQFESMIALMVRTKLLNKSGNLLVAAPV